MTCHNASGRTFERLDVFDSVEDRNQYSQAGFESGQILAHPLDDLRKRLSVGVQRAGTGDVTQASCWGTKRMPVLAGNRGLALMRES
jgi:hypothetical protein